MRTRTDKSAFWHLGLLYRRESWTFARSLFHVKQRTTLGARTEPWPTQRCGRVVPRETILLKRWANVSRETASTDRTLTFHVKPPVAQGASAFHVKRPRRRPSL